MIGRADARQHQHLGRVDGAARQDHLALGHDAVGRAALDVVDADRSRSVEHHACDVGGDFEIEVGPAQRRM